MAKIMKSYLNAYDKAKTTSYFVEVPEGKYIARNPFTRVEVELNALEYTIYRFCNMWYARYERNLSTETPVQTFDNMRYYLMALNVNAYMELLD